VDEDSSPESQRVIRSVQIALNILEVICDEPPIGVSDIGRRLGLPKATVQRVVGTLKAEGWITPVTHRLTQWAPAERLLILASKLDRGSGLQAVALPVLKTLRDQTRESVNLLVRHNRDLVIIDRVESPLAVRTYSEIGSAIPLHVSSAGKAILAALGAEVTAKIVPDVLETFTGTTHQTLASLTDEFATIRENGYAVNWSEWRDGVVGIGAAIRDAAGAPVAGIAIAVPSARCDGDRAHQLGTLLTGYVRQIEQRLHRANSRLP
jgi:DNA-binding IclR family transcriptional regulator